MCKIYIISFEKDFIFTTEIISDFFEQGNIEWSRLKTFEHYEQIPKHFFY